MAKKSRTANTTPLEDARDELYSHILKCGVLEASLEHQEEWFDDTMEFMTERFPMLTPEELDDLRKLGERYCQPVIPHGHTVAATS
jgi:hypothetical protein